MIVIFSLFRGAKQAICFLTLGLDLFFASKITPFLTCVGIQLLVPYEGSL